MIRLLLLFAITSQLLFSQLYVREYTYNASESDSKLSARKAAMRQLQLLVIEEMGIQIRSRYKKEERLEGDQYAKEISARYESFARAITKTRIIDESWDGENFYLKAEVDVDPDSIGKVFASMMPQKEDSPQGNSGPNPCDITADKAKTLLGNLSSEKNINAVVDFAMAHPIDRECNKWQMDIVKTFLQHKISTPKYREFLFSSLDKIEFVAPEDKQSTIIVEYLATIQPFSSEDLRHIISLMQRTDTSWLDNYLQLTLNAISNDKVVPYTSDLLQAAQSNRMGRPVSWDYEKTAHEIADAAGRVKSDAFEILYAKKREIFFQGLQERDLLQTFRNRYLSQRSPQKLDNLIHFIQEVAPGCKIADEYYYLLRSLKIQAGGSYGKGMLPPMNEKTDYFDDVAKIMNQTASKRQELEQSCKEYHTHELMDAYLIINRIDTPFKPTPKECVQKMISEEKRDVARRYANYLLYYGEDEIKTVEQDLATVIKSGGDKLTRIEEQLIQILSMLKSQNRTIIDYLVSMILNYSDRDRYAKKALQALIETGPSTIDTLLKHYPQKNFNDSTKIINAAIQYPMDSKILIDRLKKLPPANSRHRDLINKTILKLSR